MGLKPQTIADNGQFLVNLEVSTNPGTAIVGATVSQLKTLISIVINTLREVIKQKVSTKIKLEPFREHLARFVEVTPDQLMRQKKAQLTALLLPLAPVIKYFIQPLHKRKTSVVKGASDEEVEELCRELDEQLAQAKRKAEESATNLKELQEKRKKAKKAKLDSAVVEAEIEAKNAGAPDRGRIHIGRHGTGANVCINRGQPQKRRQLEGPRVRDGNRDLVLRRRRRR